MIDTLVLRVHDLIRHHRFVDIVRRDFMFKYEERQNVAPAKEVENFSKAHFATDTMMLNYFRIAGIGNDRLKRMSLKKINNSGHYFLNAYINKDDDFVEFNFSVPKYIYGTNVLMYVVHPWDKNFTYYRHNSLKHNLVNSYERLMRFIRYFFETEFPDDLSIDARYIEINRIDLCYNQVFLSKEDAIEYLDIQKSIQRKHTRQDSNKYREYETSFMYVNDRYSLKVYHKGAEYKKRDRKEQKKINSLHQKQVFDIQGLQNFSDRMLRYEITFRKSMLSYLFNQYVFRKNCPVHKDLMTTYKKVESIIAKNERVSTSLKQKKKEITKQKYLEENPFQKIEMNDKRNHKYIRDLLFKEKKFMYVVDDRVNEFNNITARYNYFEPRAHFSKAVFNECANFFLDFINEFQIYEKPAFNSVDDLIDAYNKVHEEDKLPKKEMLKFYKLLETMTFDEIKKSNLYSKPTFYRYKSRFKKIGITQNNLMPIKTIVSNTTLNEYHSYLMVYGRHVR